LDLDPFPAYVIAAAVLFFLLSILFSIVKIVFSSLDKNGLGPDEERLKYYALKIEELEKNRALLNGTVSFARTFANAGVTLTLTILTVELFPTLSLPVGYIAGFGISVLVLTLFSYFIPRAVARARFHPLVGAVFSIYRGIGWLFFPFVSLFLSIHNGILKLLHFDERYAFLSREEIARMDENNEDTEALDEEEREMIHSIFEMGDTSVQEIMVPRIEVKGVDQDTDLPTILKIIKKEGHSRIPVFKETIDSIVGMLYVKDLLSWMGEHEDHEFSLLPLIKKPHFVPIHKKIDDLMREMKKKRLHMAIVVDEYGGTAGIVTMEDILEEIVGDIQDEYDDEERLIVQAGEGQFNVDPHIEIHDLDEELGLNLDLENVDFNTLGGLIYKHHGDVPKVNTVVEVEGVHFTVLEMDNQRIQLVRVNVNTNAPTPSEDQF